MSDILEDQKIHLIVKDYRRMSEQHDKLVAIGKEFQAQLIAKEKELANVKAELNTIKAKKKPKDEIVQTVLNKLSELESRTISVNENAAKLFQQTDNIIANIKEIRKLLKSN